MPTPGDGRLPRDAATSVNRLKWRNSPPLLGASGGKPSSDPDSYFVDGTGAAAILGVNRARVGQLADAGLVPHVTTPRGQRIYRRAQLEVVANARLARRRPLAGVRAASGRLSA